MSGSVEDKSEHAIYENEILRHRQIRLLSIKPRGIGENDDSLIRCVLKTVRLDDEQPAIYTALSYTWGNDKDRVKIEVNGKDFQATRNLHSALEHFRNTQDPIPTLWVDAVCINQNHNNEKEAQVQFMQSIFSGANETWAWLGEEVDESSKAVDLIDNLSHVYRNSCQGSNTDPEDADETQWGSLSRLEKGVVALHHLLSRDYWYRVWIVQEIVLSKNVLFFCGRRKFFWNSLLFTSYLLNSHAESSSIHKWSQKIDPFRGIYGGVQRIMSIQSVRHDYQQNLGSELRDSLLSLLSNHRSTGATNAKDKFIALAGLAEESITTDGLYANMEVGDVYTFACHFLTKEKRHKSLDFLDSAGLRSNYPMPSWVPDWSVITKRRPVPLLYWQLATKKEDGLIFFNAPGKTKLLNRTTFSIRENALLQATGRRVGPIQTIITTPRTPQPFNKDRRDHQDHPAYPTGEHPADVLWKTLVWDRDCDLGLRSSKVWGDMFYQYLAHQPNPSSPPSLLRQWWTQCKHFKLCGSTLEELALAQKAALEEMPSNLNEELAQFKATFTMGVGYRKLATTEEGYLCLVPLDAEVGDIVVILVDCSVPVLLRRHEMEGSGYEFVGTCYVHGVMRGEAVDDLNIEDPFPEEFDIR